MKVRRAVLVAILLLGCPLSARVFGATPIQQEAPGRLVGLSPLAAAFDLPGAAASWRIVYISTDGLTGHGVLRVSGTVFVPPGPPPAGGWPIVAWAHGTVGIAPGCAPSAHPVPAGDGAYLGTWMRRGFAIVATDYQGLGVDAGGGLHPYLNARAEAYGVLDSVRAVLHGLPRTRLANQVMIVGQSQGAGAAFAAAAYAPAYAPELAVRGTVATGIPYVTPEIARALLATPRAGGFDPLALYVILLGAAQAAHDPAFRPAVAFTDAAMPVFRAASGQCAASLRASAEAAGLDLANTVRPGFAAALAPALAAMRYPTLSLPSPVFVGIGASDRDVPTATQLLLVHDACAAGTDVVAHLYAGLDHGGTVPRSLADSEGFTRTVMAGRRPRPVCAPEAR